MNKLWYPKIGGYMGAVDYFLNGNSCSESIILSMADEGLCERELLSVATPFSGGIGSGCLCGAVSGSMIVIGNLFGKNNKYGNEPIARELSKSFMDKFLSFHRATCCRVLSAGTKHGTIERKQHCTSFVEFCEKTLKETLKEVVKNG